MKKFFSIALLGLSLLFATQSFAQYQKGDKLLNAGIGLNSYYGGGLPIGGSLEFGVTDQISAGVSFDFATWGYNFGGYKWRYTFLYPGVRGSYHVNELLNLNNDKLDLYGGLFLGYVISSYSDNSGYTGSYYNAYGNTVRVGAHIGGRYYFNNNVGGFAELGYGVSALKVGVAFKF